MKDYEEKAMNVIENTKSSIRYQMDKAYRQGYYDGFEKGKDDGFDKGHAVGLENGYKQGYEEGKKAVETNKDIDDAYNRGLNDAWELVRRIENTPENGGLTNLQIEQIFGTYYPPHELYKSFSIDEAMDSMKRYEDKQKEDAELKVGDIIKVEFTQFDDSFKAVITDIDSDKGLWIIDERGSNSVIEPDLYIGAEADRKIVKTGKHIDLGWLSLTKNAKC